MAAIKKALRKYSEHVNNEQKRIIAPEWGFDQVKTPGEIRRIFERCESLYVKAKRKSIII